MNFYIGSILGGPEVSGTVVVTNIKKLACAAHSYQESNVISSEGILDIVYHVPGTIVQPEFEGLRSGKFSQNQKMLMVQIAVPTIFEDERHLAQFLVESLREAIELAAPIFKSTKIAFAKEEYLQLVDAIELSAMRA